jgi:hypothetical protein
MNPGTIDTGLMRCGQHVKGIGQCPCVASFRYTWPGRDEAFICGECVPALRSVANALGLPLQVIPLMTDDELAQRIGSQG